MKKIRIALYLRLSKEDEAEKGESTSITAQREMLHSYIKEHFTTYQLTEFVDDGCTGTNLLRPGLKKMLRLALAGELDCIAIKDFSRFSRDYIVLGTYLEQIFPAQGIRIISVLNKYDSKQQGGSTLDLGGIFQNLAYDLYSKDLSVKVKSSLNIRRESGKYLSSQSPFGYQKDTKDRHRLLVAETEARIVQRIFALALMGMSSVHIARCLNEEGVKTPMALRHHVGTEENAQMGQRYAWSASAICHILRNQIYAGDIVYGKTTKSSVGGKSCLLPRSEWKVYYNHHQPLIAREDFEKLQDSRGKTGGSKQSKCHPLTGSLCCGCCQKSLSLRFGQTPYFYCSYRYTSNQEKCVARLNDDFITAYIKEKLQAKAVSSVDVDELQETIKKNSAERLLVIGRQIKRLQGQQERLIAKKRQAYEHYVLNDKDAQCYFIQERNIEKERTDIEEKTRILEVEQANCQKKSATMSWDREQILEYLGVKQLTKEAVKRYINKIFVQEDGLIKIWWKTV